jgi:homoaconitase/3-isopropylmalate dehydratase large subunit
LLLLQVPPTMRFVLDGEMPEYLLAKDLILQVGRAAVSLFFHPAGQNAAVLTV